MTAKRGRPRKTEEKAPSVAPQDPQIIGGFHITQQDGKHYVYSGNALLGAYDTREQALETIPQ